MDFDSYILKDIESMYEIKGKYEAIKNIAISYSLDDKESINAIRAIVADKED